MKNKKALIAIPLVASIFISACSSKISLPTGNVDVAVDAAGEEQIILPIIEIPELERENYKHFDDNPYRKTLQYPLSTFSADVNTASYANMRRFVSENKLPPKDAIRAEEWINYFHYDYESPDEGEKFKVQNSLSESPWNPELSLLQIGIQAEEIENESNETSNLVFLLDVSGSMDGPDRLGLVQRAFTEFLQFLSPDDTISIVTYASNTDILVDGASTDEILEISHAIEDLVAEGSTDGGSGIIEAYKLAEKHFIEGGNNRVFLATDGDLNLGISSEGELIELIEEKKESGVFLSVLGFGRGNLQDQKMQSLAQHGNGNYHYIDSIFEARKVLHESLGQTLTALAKDVKIQVDFNPEFVQGYRLIGYESSLKDPEDFADDSVEGGTLGSGHQITVLYEIVPAGLDFPFPDVGSAYSDTESTGDAINEMLQVKIRYKEVDEDASEELIFPQEPMEVQTASRNTILATSVASFAQVMRASEYIETFSMRDALALAERIEDKDFYEEELVKLMHEADALLENGIRPTENTSTTSATTLIIE